MASPISCISIFLLPLIATSLFFQVSNATFEVKADQALIDSICEQTQDVDFCKSTFNANPRTPAADRDGLVVLSIAINIDVVQATINDTIPEIVKTLIDPVDKCYNLMGRDGPEPMIRPLWVAGPIWLCDKNNYP